MQRTVADTIDILGSAETNATVTVNSESVNRHQKYWHKALTVANSSSAAYQDINVVGVYNPSGTNEPDVVTSVAGHVFVPKSPETFSYDDGNMLLDGRFAYSWDNENKLIASETRTNLCASVPLVLCHFEYDYMSRRSSKQVSNLVSGEWAVVSSHAFVYDSWNPISGVGRTVPGEPSLPSWSLICKVGTDCEAGCHPAEREHRNGDEFASNPATASV